LGYDELQESERVRAQKYIEQVYKYFFNWMFPFFRNQLQGLTALNSCNAGLYRRCLQAIQEMGSVLKNAEFWQIVAEDPRHLFLLASSRKYPYVFYGYKGRNVEVPVAWQQAACS